ncbi:hypothetical protein [Methanocaldococcus fervens]|uniref:Uncharacterized protein n=1 Tax=Methanocaldococcus fervens (strain DSM 4213 / JCM 15782 / AG86) TaxID=573064 RepID=C7P9N5_METFA|nr:hypothetical protein [Methanocaldococcus fervens]ACV25392.1 hypothetical protein Mefer_1589 [Methanocaldococcus fervens AG86]
MERNITIGLIIAFILVVAGAFLMHKDSGNGGFLLDFLKNHTENTTTADNSTINGTINETATNITDNSTGIEEISFDASAVYGNATNAVLISINAKENITVDLIQVFASFNNINFTKVKEVSNITLPTVVEVPANENATVMYYYLDIMYNGTEYRIPSEGAYNITT